MSFLKNSERKRWRICRALHYFDHVASET